MKTHSGQDSYIHRWFLNYDDLDVLDTVKHRKYVFDIFLRLHRLPLVTTTASSSVTCLEPPNRSGWVTAVLVL
jgi:hypothetical protein